MGPGVDLLFSLAVEQGPQIAGLQGPDLTHDCGAASSSHHQGVLEIVQFGTEAIQLVGGRHVGPLSGFVKGSPRAGTRILAFHCGVLVGRSLQER